jgi:hypothetical protein
MEDKIWIKGMDQKILLKKQSTKWVKRQYPNRIKLPKCLEPEDIAVHVCERSHGLSFTHLNNCCRRRTYWGI